MSESDASPVNESAQETAPTLLTAVYIHSHECPWKDEQVIVHPNCSKGVAFLLAPTCISLKCMLELVSLTAE